MHMGDNRDNGNVNADYVAKSDGNWDNDANTGVFHLNVNNSVDGNSNIGSRLVLKCLSLQLRLY